MNKEIKIVRKDKLLAGYNGNLESVIIHDSSDEEVATSNGVFVTVGGLLDGHREIKKATLASEATKSEDVLLVHNSEVMYDERLNKLEDFIIEKGKAARAYRLYDGDIITLTEDLFDDDVAEDDELIVKANGLLGKGDTEDAKVVFTVIENCGNELHHTANAWAVQVSRN